MTTSATNTFNLTAQRLIDLALMDIGVNGPGGSIDPNLRIQALDVLNLIIKGADCSGVFTWRTPRITQTLTSGVAAYALANNVTNLAGTARYTQAGATAGSQVTTMTEEEYMSLPDRTIQGTPYRYFTDSALDTTGLQFMTLYLYPVPPNTGDTLEYVAVVKAKDVTDLGQTLDAPQKWLNVYRRALAAELAPAYGAMDRVSYLKKLYDDAFEAASEDDGERGDMQIVPWGQSLGYGYGSWGQGGAR